MMKTILRQLIVLPLLVGVMAMLYACGTANGRATAGAGANQPFNATYVLKQGASAAITQAATQGIAGAATAPTVRLDRVNDSRCRVCLLYTSPSPRDS